MNSTNTDVRIAKIFKKLISNKITALGLNYGREEGKIMTGVTLYGPTPVTANISCHNNFGTMFIIRFRNDAITVKSSFYEIDYKFSVSDPNCLDSIYRIFEDIASGKFNKYLKILSTRPALTGRHN